MDLKNGIMGLKGWSEYTSFGGNKMGVVRKAQATLRRLWC